MPDETIIRINTSEAVAKTRILEKIKPWLTIDANLRETHFQLLGREVDRFYTAKFLGDMEEAKRRMEQAHTQLRNMDGSWNDFEIEAPQGTNVKVFISKDKTRTQLVREKAGRRLLQAFRQRHEGPNWQFNKTTGTITVDWVPIAKVEVDMDGTASIAWNGAEMQKKNYQKELVAADFLELSAAAGAAAAASRVEWSI